MEPTKTQTGRAFDEAPVLWAAWAYERAAK